MQLTIYCHDEGDDLWLEAVIPDTDHAFSKLVRYVNRHYPDHRVEVQEPHRLLFGPRCTVCGPGRAHEFWILTRGD